MVKNTFYFFRRLSIVFILFHSTLFAQSTTFNIKDINGVWKCTKPGKEITIEIQQSKGIVISVEGTSIPSDLLNGALYEAITFQDGTWKAIRNKWIYPGVNGTQAEEGHWEKGENVTMQLDDSKNNLIVVGHWNFTRVNTASNVVVLNSLDENSENNTEILTEEYGEILATYRMFKTTSKTGILAKFENRSTIKRVDIIIRDKENKYTTYHLEPGNILTLSIEGIIIDIQIAARDSNQEQDINYMNFIKGEIREIIIDEDGTPRSKQSVHGIRG